MEYISIIVQIIAGLVLTYVIYIIALYITKSDKLAVEERAKLLDKNEVKIFSGVLNSSETASNSEENSWNTSIPFLRNYIPINPSMNTLGGAQFTYSFWINVGDPQKATGKTIFLKGDKKKYKYSVEEKSPSNDWINKKVRNGRAIYCPMLKFGSSPLEFVLKFNTFHRMHEEVKIQRVKDDNSLIRHNLPGILGQNWFMMTITFEDNAPISDFDRGIFIRVYINDTLYQMERIPSTLRQNRGNFHILPNNTNVKNLKIADFSYYNYALSDKEVRERAAIPPKIKQSASYDGIKNFETVAQNEMDMYNI